MSVRRNGCPARGGHFCLHTGRGRDIVRGHFFGGLEVTSINLTLRSERPGDEEAIDFVVCRAFGCMHEAHLVRMIRETYSGFDPRFSVLA